MWLCSWNVIPYSSRVYLSYLKTCKWPTIIFLRTMLFTYVAYIIYSSGNYMIFSAFVWTTLKYGIGRNNNCHSLVSGVTIVRQFGDNKCICSQTQPVTISELGSSDHNMVLLKHKAKQSVDTGCVTRLAVRCTGQMKTVTFNMALSAIK